MITWLTTIIGILLLLMGGYVSLFNWSAFFHNLRTKSGFVSAVPFIGGIMLCAGLWLINPDYLSRYWWICLAVDYGSLPMVLGAVIVGPIHILIDLCRRIL